MKITKLKINGRIMFVCEEEHDNVTISEGAPHAHYCLNRSDVHTELAAFERVVQRIGSNCSSVIELFGGSGWHSSAIQALAEPENHLVLEFDGNCVESVRRSLPHVKCIQTDSYHAVTRLKNRTWDWVHADFNEFTYMRQSKGNYGDVLNHIFRASKRYVTITDSAVYGLVRFAKNRKAYANVIGMDEDDWRDYYKAMSRWYRDQFGFVISHVVVWQRMASMCILEKSKKNRKIPKFDVCEVKEKAVINVLGTESVSAEKVDE